MYPPLKEGEYQVLVPGMPKVCIVTSGKSKSQFKLETRKLLIQKLDQMDGETEPSEPKLLKTSSSLVRTANTKT